MRKAAQMARPAAAFAAAVTVAGLAPSLCAQETAAAEEEEEAEAPSCLQMYLLPDSSKALLRRFPPMHERELAERVLLRPCITNQLDSTSLQALAYVEDGKTQSMLVCPANNLWEGAPDAFGGSGYPVIPISIKEPPADAPPPPHRDDAQTEESREGDEDVATGSEMLSTWEEIEEPWRLLEAAGVLIVIRGEDAMPVSVKLADGANEWHGNLPTKDGNVRRVGVTLLDPPKGMELLARTQVPECGFCRFMRAGPCGDVFTQWEKCIDRARDSNADFVELCGPETLELKKCTDKHPEYYGELSGGSDDE